MEPTARAGLDRRCTVGYGQNDHQSEHGEWEMSVTLGNPTEGFQWIVAKSHSGTKVRQRQSPQMRLFERETELSLYHRIRRIKGATASTSETGSIHDLSPIPAKRLPNDVRDFDDRGRPVKRKRKKWAVISV